MSENSPKGKFGFVMEQQVGMKTYYLNWRRGVESLQGVDATWVPIEYYKQGGLIEKLKFIPGSIRAAMRCSREVDEGLGNSQYDAVLFNTYNPAVVNRKAALRQPSFLVFDVTPKQYDDMSHWYGHETGGNRALNAWKSQKVKETLQSATGLFAWSNWAGASAVEDYGVSPDRLHVLAPGVDVELWRPAPEGERKEDGKVRILFTGYDFERKGGDLLLRWARETSLKNWELHIATRDIPDVPAGVTVHTGLKSNSQELVSLAQNCDIFALPTRADCFSLVSLEAMATGLPVIATNVGGIPDIIRDGETGYLIDPDDYDALHQRLDALVLSPQLRKSMGSCGRQVVCENFNTLDSVHRGLKFMSEA